MYLLTLPLQILTNGSVIEQGTTPLVALTAIHAGLVATLFWTLLANAIVATQIVEDGTLSSLIVRSVHVGLEHSLTQCHAAFVHHRSLLLCYDHLYIA
jgi:hypothetical protein